MRRAADGQLYCACQTHGDEASLNETWDEYQEWQTDSQNPHFTSRLLIVIPTDNESLFYLWPRPGHFVNAFAWISGKPLADPAAIRSAEPAAIRSVDPAAIQSGDLAVFQSADPVAIPWAELFDKPLGNPAGKFFAHLFANFLAGPGGNLPASLSGKASSFAAALAFAPFIWLRLLTCIDWVLLVAVAVTGAPLPRFLIAGVFAPAGCWRGVGDAFASDSSASDFDSAASDFDSFASDSESSDSDDSDLPASDLPDSAADDSVASDILAGCHVHPGKGRVTGVLPVSGGWRVYRAPAGCNPFADIMAQWKRDGGGHDQQ